VLNKVYGSWIISIPVKHGALKLGFKPERFVDLF